MSASKNHSELFRWLILLIYCVFLFVLHTISIEKIPKIVAHANDKVLHFFDFLLLALLAFRAFVGSSRKIFSHAADQKAAGFSFAYGGLLEWAQHLIPSRSMSFADWGADTLGILVGFLAFRLARVFQRPAVPRRV